MSVLAKTLENTLSTTDLNLTTLITRAERVLAQLEAWLPPAPPEIDWTAHAYPWRKRGSRGWLDAVINIPLINMTHLQPLEPTKSIIDRNTLQLVGKTRANNVLST